MDISKRFIKHDLIFFIGFIILLIILISSNLIYPFNRYLAYSEDAAEIITYQFPPILITIVFLIAGALLFISWSFYSKENINIILILSGLFLILIGSLSLGKIFSSDAIYQVGIINRLLNNIVIPLEKRVHYPGLFFHYMMLPFSILFTPYNAVLYIAPIISFLLSVPLGNRLIKIPKDFKNKLIIGIIYFWFPIGSTQKYSSTPYTFLISIYSLLIFFLLSGRRNKFYYCFFLAVIGSLAHIHGIFMFIILFSALLRKRIKNNKKYYISQILTSLLYIIPYLILVFSKEIIIKNHSLYEYLIALDNNLITFILYTITKSGGYLSTLFLPKLLSGDLFSIWYSGQLLLFFVFLILIITFFINNNAKKNDFEVFEEKKFHKLLIIILPIIFIVILLITSIYLTELIFVFKITTFNFFSLWYLGQWLLFFIFLTLVIYLFFRIFYQKAHISYTSFFDEIKTHGSMPLILSISYHLILLLTLALFFSYNLQLWRFLDILGLTGFLLLLYKLYPIIKKIKVRYIYILSFVFIVSSPIIIYNQYTPYNENEEKLLEWSVDYYNQSNESTYLFMDITTYKLFWALAPELDRDLYQWEREFWLGENISLYEYFDWQNNQKNLNLLIILTPRNIAWEAQFNNVNMTKEINKIINDYSTSWLYDYEGNKILLVNLE